MTPEPCEYGDVILKLDSINVTYDDKPILRDLSVELCDVKRVGVTQGQVVALLGPSGMGKTTLFRVLAGLEAPDTGQVLVEGKQVARGQVGVVAQNYPLFAHRTVISNLVVAGRQSGMSGSEATAKAMDLLTKFGMEEQAIKYPSQVSGGQRQRIAIAQQFMCSEHFLLMDEPFSGLDLLAIDRVIRLVDDIAQTDEMRTFIIVTHDISSAIEVADTLWIMGRDRDPSGQIIPGARIVKTFNLAERGLAWQKGITNTPEFLELRQEVRDLFTQL